MGTPVTTPKERNWYFLVGFSSLALSAMLAATTSMEGLLGDIVFWPFVFGVLMYAAGTHLWRGFDAALATARSPWPMGLALASGLAYLGVLAVFIARYLAMEWHPGIE